MKKFGDKVKKLGTYKTPGAPGLTISRPKDQKERFLPKELQTEYRSGVGMLLFLVKHSRPDLANITRELAKVMDNPTKAAMKELYRAIKFTLDTKDYGLKIEPLPLTKNKEWTMTVYSDSDWAGDKDTRKSVSGYILFINGVPVSWKSKSQQSISLSSSEAELIALSEAAKEIKFIAQCLLSMGVPIQLPIICRVDNIGAIFMAENVTTSQRTKHIDLRYRFITEFIEDNFIKIIFVKTAENRSDPFTKNIDSKAYDAHTGHYISKKGNLEIKATGSQDS